MLASLLTILGAVAATQAARHPDYTRNIKPILERSCTRCHGAARQSGGLRLDRRDTAMRAIVPHDPAASPLLRRVTSADDAMRMPPAASGLPRLPEGEVATLRAWVQAGGSGPDTGAGQPEHWSLRPLRRSAPPSAGHPIDAFVRATLTRKKLTLSRPADRTTLLRRVTFDLTGLPPAPAEVDAFVRDARPGAYERVVDRLLASPRYGERWARHWLDTIHFADSHGFEHDIGRDNAWPYRDYVIAALNRDTAWPRFIREQLAADVFFPTEPGLTPALGYLGAGTFDLSAYTTAPNQFELMDRDDLVTQTMAAFASTTANCARCHAHKFDPIPQADYYALQAAFAGLIKGDVTYDTAPGVAAARTRWQALTAAADRRDTAVLLSESNRPLVNAWLADALGGRRWQPMEIVSFAAQGSELTRDADGAITSGGPRPEKDTYTTTVATPLRRVSAIRLEVLASERLPMRGPGRQDNGNLHLSEIDVQLVADGAPPRTLKIARASADFNQDGWGVERAIDGDPATAWGVFPAVGRSHQAVFALAEPALLPPGARLTVTLRQNHGGGHLIGRYRLSATDADAAGMSALPQEVEEALRLPEDRRSAAQRLALAAQALRERAQSALARLPAPSHVFAAAARVDVPTIGMRSLDTPRVIHRLERGDLDKPREIVAPGALSAVAGLPARFPLRAPGDESGRRAALADWLAHPRNPLTWRSIVNRVWHYHFGRGLCDTPSDLGRMGGVPSHPELIDWLAAWFRDDAKGSLKALHRLIVTSATYRQQSGHRPEAARVDGENRLLWRQNRQRLDADAVRDFALSVSGRLDLTMGGPGVKHFLSSPGPQLTPALNYAAYDWSAPGAGRRSIYRYVWRGIADPFMESLDFPDLGLLAPTRTFSVSALQALTLYNDAFVLSCSDALAQRIATQTTDPGAQAVSAARRVWLRPPTPLEKRLLEASLRRHGLPALCRVLLNSNAFLFVD